MRNLPALALAAVVAGGLLTVASPAGATVQDARQVSRTQAAGPINYSCGARLRVSRDVPRNTWHRMAKAKGRRGMVYLYEADGVYRGRNVWWAWGTSLRSGDRISIDWTDDGGRTYHACHAVVRGGGRRSVTSYAVDAPNGRKFRACVKAAGKWSCTRGWWEIRYS
ncbi:hypothetical protein ACFYUV_20065 [Nonomuraea sp. NPDC003560]|uniref:hypothetical protein n=1 Tax=Nonomuraea sp. NPDC003560 TaxID=3364341 RepID=UPI0036C39444